MNTSSVRQLALLTTLASARQPLSQEALFARLPNFYNAQSRRQTLEKMFERDLAALSASGTPIVAEEADDGMVYRLLGGKDLLDRDFSLSKSESAELRTLLADPAVRGQLHESAQRALSNLLCFHAPFDTDAAGEKREQGQAEARIQKLAAASREERAVTIDYPQHGHAKVESRDLSPLGVYFYRGAGYVVGMCHRAIKPKTFAVEKIQRVRASRHAYLDPPEDFDLHEHAYRNNYLLSSGDTKEVVLLVSADAAWKLQEEAPFAVERQLEDGSLIARLAVRPSDFFYRQVLSFGKHAEILGPPELRQGLLEYMEGQRG